MVLIKEKECLSFDDVLLEPQFSAITTRKDIKLLSKLENLGSYFPIISAPMDTVTETEMACAMHNFNGLGIVHRYMSIEKQINIGQEIKNKNCKCGFAVGTTGDYLERAKELINKFPASLICIDVAHGDHSLVHNALFQLRSELPSNVHLMVGNVATFSAGIALAAYGANSLRVGIGGGSICSTRTQTGHGIPTLESIIECSKIKERHPQIAIVADGGIRTTGDIVKCLAAGADFVMLGSMLAGTHETPNDFIYETKTSINGTVRDVPTGNKYKVYRGMASREAQEDWKGSANSLEGISVKIPSKGPVLNILKEIKTNMASGLSYSGADSIQKFQKVAKFIKITHAGLIESQTHIQYKDGTK